MDVLLVTTTNNLLGLGARLQDEGHKVKLFGSQGNGLLERVKHPYEAIKECQFILADGAIDPRIHEWAKTFNKPVVGANPLADLLNKDVYREYQIASKLGVPLPETEVIHEVADMYEKVLNWNNVRTTIRYDREAICVDHQRWLAWAMDKLPLNKKILLQRPAWGEEVHVVGWFDGLRWARPFLLKTPNEDRLKGSSVLGLFKREWIEQLIQPWERFLKQIQYKGPIRVRANLTRDKVETQEVYIGFEFPSLYAFFEGLKGPVGEFLHSIAFSTCEDIDFTTDYASSVVVGTALKEPDGAPIVGLDEGNRKHIFFGNVERVEDEILIGKSPEWVYVACARGRNLEESFGRLNFTRQQVSIPEQNATSGLGPLHGQWFNKLRELGRL